MERRITDNLDALLEALPPSIATPLCHHSERHDLIEVVMDLGRPPEARFSKEEIVLLDKEVTDEDIDYVVSRIGKFGDDNRAGIARTLHRISAMRNRQGKIVALTCRVGRAVYGTIAIIQDLIGTEQSILLLGRPGIGKTTMLREVARVLADDFKKRVIIVDTSNEIAGDGDIPHPAIGRARRMQVVTPSRQHAVMIEAVENHMPEVIVIDEMGTELEATAARTIAERGVQLIATAHGNTLENLIMNPTLADLVGGIQTVTLGDEEARRRGTQKSILERKAPPTFEVVVEIQDRDRVAVHPQVASTVDDILRGRVVTPEVRWLDGQGQVRKDRGTIPTGVEVATPTTPRQGTRLYAFGINRSRLEEAVKETGMPVTLVEEPSQASLMVTSKTYYRRKPQKVRDAEVSGLPIYVLRSNTLPQMRQLLHSIHRGEGGGSRVEQALREAEEAITLVLNGQDGVAELRPQSSYIRRLQHQMAEGHGLSTRSLGKEPQRRVRIFKGQ